MEESIQKTKIVPIHYCYNPAFLKGSAATTSFQVPRSPAGLDLSEVVYL